LTETEDNSIKFIKSDGTSFIFVTKNNDVFFMYDIYSENPKRIKLLSRTNIEMNFDNFSQLSIDYYYKDI